MRNESSPAALTAARVAPATAHSTALACGGTHTAANWFQRFGSSYSSGCPAPSLQALVHLDAASQRKAIGDTAQRLAPRHRAGSHLPRSQATSTASSASPPEAPVMSSGRTWRHAPGLNCATCVLCLAWPGRATARGCSRLPEAAALGRTTATPERGQPCQSFVTSGGKTVRMQPCGRPGGAGLCPLWQGLM
jgi:hypothetical protein